MKPISLAVLALTSALAQAQGEPISLADALRSAYEKRPAIAAARLRVEQAEAHARMLGAFPSTELALGLTTPPEAGGSDDDFVLSQQLDLFGRVRAGRAVGRALVTIEQARLRAATLEVQTQVMRAYGEAAAAELRAQVAHRILETAQALYESSQKRFEEGRVPEVQVIRARIEQRRAAQDSERRQTELEAARKELAALIGSAQADVDDEVLSANYESPAGAMAVQRPDVLQKQAEIDLIAQELEQVRASYRPTFEVQARRSAWNEADGQFGLRLQLTMPLFDHGLKKAELATVEKRAEAAEQEFQETMLLANVELTAALADQKKAQDQVNSYREILEEARTLVAKSQLGYEEGATTLVEVLEATRAMREVEEGFVEARASSFQAHVRLLEAYGQLMEAPHA